MPPKNSSLSKWWSKTPRPKKLYSTPKPRTKKSKISQPKRRKTQRRPKLPPLPKPLKYVSIPFTPTPEYYRYIESKEWKDKSLLLRSFFGHKCAFDASKRSDCVHHLTYANFTQELPMDLLPLNWDIHERIHKERLGSALDKTMNVLGDNFVMSYRKRMQGITWEQVREQVNRHEKPRVTICQAIKPHAFIQRWVSRAYKHT